MEFRRVLFRSGMVENKKIAGEEMIFVRECKEPKAVSILVRGSTEHVVDEVKRGMDDAVLGIIAALETELSRRLKTYADSVGGREQLAINAFAEALEVIPRTLAESTGRDPIDILVDLRTKHDKGGETMGVDVFKAAVADMKQKIGRASCRER